MKKCVAAYVLIQCLLPLLSRSQEHRLALESLRGVPVAEMYAFTQVYYPKASAYTQHFRFDEQGNVLRTGSANCPEQQLVYDADGRLLQVQTFEGGEKVAETKRYYDPVGRLVCQEERYPYLYISSSWEYDPQGRVSYCHTSRQNLYEQQSDFFEQQYVYNSAGKTARIICRNARGEITGYRFFRYHAGGQLAEMSVYEGGQLISHSRYTYHYRSGARPAQAGKATPWRGERKNP